MVNKALALNAAETPTPGHLLGTGDFSWGWRLGSGRPSEGHVEVSNI